MGELVVTRDTDDVFHYVWTGDDTLRVSLPLLRTAEQNAIRFEVFPNTSGVRFSIGPYELEVIEVDSGYGVMTARRIRYEDF